MSLDVWLTNDTPATVTGTGVFVRENGSTVELTIDEVMQQFPGSNITEFTTEANEVFSGNLTHNLGDMAEEAGLYDCLWHPTQTLAKDLIAPLGQGLGNLLSDPERYKQFNPLNGWGSYDQLVNFVSRYLSACIKYPNSKIGVSR